MNRVLPKELEECLRKAEVDGEHLDIYDVIYNYHENPEHIVSGVANCGVEIESYNNESKDILALNALEISNCRETYILEMGYGNSPNAVWDATEDPTVTVEFVSKPLHHKVVETAIRQLYSVGNIEGGEGLGNHYHVNLDWVDSIDVFSLLAIYMAPEIKKASRRSFKLWNKWCACKYKSLKTFEDMVHFYNGEYQRWDYPLVKESSRYNTIEFRGFTTANDVEITVKQFKAVMKLTKMSNDISKELDTFGIMINSPNNSNCHHDVITDIFDTHIEENNMYELLNEIAEGK